MQSKDAIEYIKESSFYINKRYLWLKALMDLILNDEPTDEYILKIVENVLQINKGETDNALEKVNEPEEKLKAEENIIVKKIKSIIKLKNIGLLDIDNPIQFKDGLNVFYGKNGSGKSSIYVGLCKALGHDKTIISNVNNEQDNSACEISLVNDNSIDATIKWETGLKCMKTNVQIFDSQISNFIVDNDQPNQFELSHFKSEYFVLLHLNFDKITIQLVSGLTKVEPTKISLEKIITEKANVFWENMNTHSIKSINEIQFTEDDDKELQEYEREINSLRNNDIEAIIKNIRTAIDQIDKVFKCIGKSVKLKNEQDEEEMKWELNYDNSFFKKINQQIELYSKAREAYEESGKNKLSALIPLHWITNEKWDLFINKSIEFLKTIEKDEQKKYQNEQCPYCQQPLQTASSQELLKIYHQIRDEHKEKLEQLAIDLDRLLKKFTDAKTTLTSINNKVIESEFKYIGLTKPIKEIDLSDIFEKINMSLTSKTLIDNIEAISDKVKEYWNEYFPVHERLLSKSIDLSENLFKKAEKIAELDIKAKPLRNKKALFENKETILQYLRCTELSKQIKNKIDDITSIKRATSTLETQFSKEIPLQVFKEYLYKEYEYFNFIPPPAWRIAASTHHGANERIYNLKDKRLSDIFSEGERKIHALADFFAQLELNKFQGVFIFDDPVNSLDEERIEYVRDRIIELVQNGNQVIIFTHNMVFLNTLVDTSDEKVNLISKLANQIVIETDLNLGTEAELSKLLKEITNRINKLAGKNENEIDSFELKNIYDLMSGYLESYVEVKIFRNIVNRYRPNIRMNSLNKMKNFETKKLEAIIDLYKQTSRKGSRHSQPVGSPLPKYSELTEHFQALKDISS